MNTNQWMSRFFILCEWITRFFFSNAIWLLFNLPVFYCVFNVYTSTTPAQLLVNMLLAFLTAPFFLFPATTALFGVVRKWIIEENHIPLFKSFIKIYKESYKRSVLGGLLFVPLWMLLLIDYQYFTITDSPLYYPFLVVSMFLMVFTVNYFANTVHYELSFFQSVKNSLLLSLGRPVHTVLTALVLVGIVYASFRITPLLIFLCMGSVSAYLSFYIYYKALK